MHGNMWEWVSDWWTDKFEFAQLTVDPQGPKEPQPFFEQVGAKVWRGGSFRNPAIDCTSARRLADGLGWNDHPWNGFRVALSVTQAAEDRIEPPKREPPKQESPVTNSIGMKLVHVHAGELTMGSPDAEPLRELEEEPHGVALTKSFFLGAYEVTQDEYERVVGHNPSYFSPDGEGAGKVEALKPEERKRLPVEFVNWAEAVAFCKKLSERPEEKRAGRVYRLPTEAEWEYGCRAGTTTPFSLGKKLALAQANFNLDVTASAYDFDIDANWDRVVRRTAPVGSYPPNPFGLYDMHGNVREWCEDDYAHWSYFTRPKQDPVLVLPGGLITLKVTRGGSWEDWSHVCRSARRTYRKADDGSRDVGFRVVMTQSEKTP
jgi:formylglycine-generating enzyme required for sulfatase activity